MNRLVRFVIVTLLTCASSRAEKAHDLQQEILTLSPTAAAAVVPIQAWPTKMEDANPSAFAVVGTGFLVDGNGDFITAAHVANVKQVAGSDVYLTAVVRQ
jgi:hypothetical protein